jgi:GGDEF domain-containing protein
VLSVGHKLDSIIRAGDPFFERAGLELKRAERYRIFLSLVVMDLDSATKEAMPAIPDALQQAMTVITENIREIDVAAVLAGHKLALLLPETPRQGAEAAARRLTDLIRKEVLGNGNGNSDKMIPTEMASYPDAAGVRTVADVLIDFTEKKPN